LLALLMALPTAMAVTMAVEVPVGPASGAVVGGPAGARAATGGRPMTGIGSPPGVAAAPDRVVDPRAGETAPVGWLPARADFAWSFPTDHWAHPGYRSEWWYITGHLETDEPSPRRFAYQFTVFRVGVLPKRPRLGSDWAASDLVMGHAAISDLDRGRHVFSELLYRAAPLLGGFPPAPTTKGTQTDHDGGSGPLIGTEGPASGRLAWSRAPAGTETLWALDWDGAGFAFRAGDDALGFAFDLEARPQRPVVLQGPHGYSRKGADEGAASLYYSFTRLATAGTLTIDGRRVPVHGRSWMDREFGSGVLAADQSGWDWFSLQLDDGRDLMLYLLRDRSGGIDFGRGTLVESDGSARYLAASEFSVQSGRSWKSPATGAVYPSRWTVHVDGARPALVLDLVPELADQENRGKLAGGLSYWEGAVEVRGADGKRIGQGFVELTGYGTSNRPAL
jgi:predicted secreted hydrolase